MLCVHERREERKRRAKGFLPSLRSSIGCFSSGQEQKFIASMRGTHEYLERRISSNNQEGRFWEIKVVGFRRVPTFVSKLKEVGDSSYLGLLSIFGPGKEGFSFKGMFSKEKLDFRVLFDVSLPRQRHESSHGRLVLRLGEGKVHLGEGFLLGVGVHA